MLHRDELNQLQREDRKFRQIHRKVAKQMGAGKLVCATCHREQALDLEQVEKYLREGWPNCCEGTMGFEPAPPEFAELKVATKEASRNL